MTPPSAPSTGTLYLVALPIGNPRDITYRSIDVLKSVDVIAAEDTRDVARLLAAHDIAAPTVSYHDFNEQSRASMLVKRLVAGQSVALVSDAGTPLISDPGYRIVTASIEAGITVNSIPGPCAAVTALVASGLPVHRFLFAGFPPRAAGKRRALFESLRHEPGTLVFYEAPHRLLACLEDVLLVLGDRKACIARSVTKPTEHYRRGSVSFLIERLQKDEHVRGETTLLVAGSENDAASADISLSAEELMLDLIAQGLEGSAVAAQLHVTLGVPRRKAYQMIVAAKRSMTGSTEM